MKWTIDWTNPNDTIAQMVVGDTFDAPSANGFKTVTFRVVDKGHVSVDGSTNTVTLQADNVLTFEDGSVCAKEFDYSLNKWSSSCIATWLNNDFLNAFTSGKTESSEEYIQAQAFINALKKPTLSTWVYGTEVTARETLTNWKFWLPSYTQMGGSGSVNVQSEDECFDYYKDNGTPIGDDDSTKRKRTLVGGTDGRRYWLRSAFIYDSTYEYCVSYIGGVTNTVSLVSLTYAVSPCITLTYAYKVSWSSDLADVSNPKSGSVDEGSNILSTLATAYSDYEIIYVLKSDGITLVQSSDTFTENTEDLIVYAVPKTRTTTVTTKTGFVYANSCNVTMNVVSGSGRIVDGVAAADYTLVWADYQSYDLFEVNAIDNETEARNILNSSELSEIYGGVEYFENGVANITKSTSRPTSSSKIFASSDDYINGYKSSSGWWYEFHNDLTSTSASETLKITDSTPALYLHLGPIVYSSIKLHFQTNCSDSTAVDWNGNLLADKTRDYSSRNLAKNQLSTLHTRKRYTFLGYSNKQDGGKLVYDREGNITSFGSTFVMDESYSERTVYAQWEEGVAVSVYSCLTTGGAKILRRCIVEKYGTSLDLRSLWAIPNYYVSSATDINDNAISLDYTITSESAVNVVLIFTEDTTTDSEDPYIDAAGNGVRIFRKDQDITLTPGWNSQTFTYHFDTEQHSGVTYPEDVSYAKASKIPTSLPVPTLSVEEWTYAESFSFTGWYTTDDYSSVTQITDASGNVLSTASSTINSYEDEMTLYAHWEKTKVRVTFNANGGTCGTSSSLYTIGSTYGSLPTASMTATGHYNFVGWFTAANGGTQITTESTVSDISTLYAHYQQYYIVSFDGKGNATSSSNSSPNDQNCNVGESITLPAAPTYSRSGYNGTFNGWYTATSGGTKAGAAGASYTPTGDVTLYANWTETSSGGGGGSGGGTTSNVYIYYTKPSNATISLVYPSLDTLTSSYAYGAGSTGIYCTPDSGYKVASYTADGVTTTCSTGDGEKVKVTSSSNIYSLTFSIVSTGSGGSGGGSSGGGTTTTEPTITATSTGVLKFDGSYWYYYYSGWKQMTSSTYNHAVYDSSKSGYYVFDEYTDSTTTLQAKGHLFTPSSGSVASSQTTVSRGTKDIWFFGKSGLYSGNVEVTLSTNNTESDWTIVPNCLLAYVPSSSITVTKSGSSTIYNWVRSSSTSSYGACAIYKTSTGWHLKYTTDLDAGTTVIDLDGSYTVTVS